LKPGGILRCQLNGLPPHARQYDTWSGVRITPDEIAAFLREQNLQLLALEQIWTQYMWTTCRKRSAAPPADRKGPVASLRRISNAVTGEAVAPASGPLADLSIWVHHLPEECDLLTMKVLADGRECRLTYVGEPNSDGVVQVNVALPEGIRTGMVPVQMTWFGQPVCAPAWVRIMPAGPCVPRITTITDGINLLSGTRIVTGSVKLTMTEVKDAGTFHATIDGREALEVDAFCTDPIAMRYEFNFKIPPGTTKGMHEVQVKLGRRSFAPLTIEVA